jgi:hypothetical protein
VRHYYYGRFSCGFHAKDDFFNYLSMFLIKVGGGFIEAENLGLDDQGPGDAQALGRAILFPPEATFDPEPRGAGTLGQGRAPAMIGFFRPAYAIKLFLVY